MNVSLERIGYDNKIEEAFSSINIGGQEIARVVSEHRERYIVRDEHSEYEAEIIGNMRFTAQERSDFPAVGDWVAISRYDENKVLIHSIVYRKNVLKRKAVGSEGEYQIIASNIDNGFIVEAVNRDFSLNRFERYITICKESGIVPVLILNKIDLLNEEEVLDLVQQVELRFPGIQFIKSSCVDGSGFDLLRTLLEEGQTCCFLGSSGVGKSTIINLLAGDELMLTSEISADTDRGRHTTSHRELIVLDSGGILIDNPGMREIGVTGSAELIEDSFAQISRLSTECRYSDCTHEHEEGCAVLFALNSDELDYNSYKNYLKLRREAVHYQSSEAEKRKKGKDFAKMVKEVKSKKVK